jgi:hypothetical protein
LTSRILQTEELGRTLQETVVIRRFRFVEQFHFDFLRFHFELMNFDERFRFWLSMVMVFQVPDGEETLFSLVLHPWILQTGLLMTPGVLPLTFRPFWQSRIELLWTVVRQCGEEVDEVGSDVEEI